MDLLPGSLISDVMERVLGFVPESDLKTARLVNSAFQTAASCHVTTITMRKPCEMPYSVSRLHPITFPRLRKLDVHLEGAHHLAGWVDPGVSPMVTHLTLSPSSGADTSSTTFAVQLPSGFLHDLGVFRNLRWLTVGGAHVPHWRGYDALLPGLASLQRVQITCERLEDLRALQRMPNLARVDVVFTARFETGQAHGVSGDVSFPALQSLRVAGSADGRSDDLLPWVGALTQLTCFTWAYAAHEVGEPDITPLTRLSALKSLTLKPKRFGVCHPPNLLPLAVLSGLTKLHFGLCRYPEPGPGTLAALSRLTHLVELKVWGDRHPVSALASLNVEGLRRLELGPLWNAPNADGLAVLRRATNLTLLCFHGKNGNEK
jgi:hypothetical protein